METHRTLAATWEGCVVIFLVQIRHVVLRVSVSLRSYLQNPDLTPKSIHHHTTCMVYSNRVPVLTDNVRKPQDTKGMQMREVSDIVCAVNY